ncbi:hypothetical protein MtrunA17_Chr5g0426901 [Medicago truncatula]|uniref:Uncharacterized protein n=1 Tax=Medicago truncatula TaxID=3880 RepID=G7KAK3_MEDTR|nr:hypothetical protein MTR_5g065030 [Medicago truncatula]RHN56202.1 hypothetical protein MtrunA17_Chr5g0426901 [Medicago truncatula]
MIEFSISHFCHLSWCSFQIQTSVISPASSFGGLQRTTRDEDGGGEKNGGVRWNCERTKKRRR